MEIGTFKVKDLGCLIMDMKKDMAREINDKIQETNDKIKEVKVGENKMKINMAQKPDTRQSTCQKT